MKQALEHVLIEQQAEIVDELKQRIVHIVKDSNGNHVVQKVIQMFPEKCIPSHAAFSPRAPSLQIAF